MPLHWGLGFQTRICGHNHFDHCSQPPEGRDEERRTSLSSTQTSLPTQITKSCDWKKKSAQDSAGQISQGFFPTWVSAGDLCIPLDPCANDGGRLCRRLTEKKKVIMKNRTKNFPVTMNTGRMGEGRYWCCRANTGPSQVCHLNVCHLWGLKNLTCTV